MKPILGWIIFCTLLVVTETADASTRFFVRGGFGWGFQTLKEFFDDNDALREELRRDSDNPASFQSDFDDVGIALGGGGEFGIHVTETLSVSLGGDYEAHDVNNSASDDDFVVTDDFDLSVLDVTLGVDYWFPQAPGAFVGASLGVAMAEVTRTLQLMGRNGGGSATIAGRWDDSGVMLGVRGGYQYQAASGLFAFTYFGVRVRPVGSLTGTVTLTDNLGGTTVIEEVSGAYVSFDTNEPVEFDFTGWYGRIGIGIAFATVAGEGGAP